MPKAINISTNFEKTILQTALGYLGSEIGSSVFVSAAAAAFGVGAAPVIAGVSGAIVGGLAASVIFNYLYSFLPQDLLSSTIGNAVAQAFNAGQPYSLLSTQPDVPSFQIYSNGTIAVPELGVVLNSNGTITTATGTLVPQQNTYTQGFSYQFNPSDGSASTVFGAGVQVDQSGTASLSLSAQGPDGTSASTPYFYVGPDGPVSEQFSPDGSQGDVNVYMAWQGNGIAFSQWNYNGTTVVRQIVGDTSGNVTTFGFDVNGAVDNEQIHPAGQGSFTSYTWDTLGQQPWTTVIQELSNSGVQEFTETFNRDTTVSQYGYDPNGQLDQDMTYTPGQGATRWTWDTLDQQPYSAFNQTFNAQMQPTSLDQFERSGDVFIDTIDPGTGRVETDTHYRPDGGDTTWTVADWNQTEPWSTIVQDFTPSGALIDQSVFNRDGSVDLYHYDTSSQQLTEEDIYTPNGTTQEFYGNSSQPWTYIINQFDASGNFQSQSVGFKDGSSAYSTSTSAQAPNPPATTSGTTSVSTATATSAASSTANAGSPGTNVIDNSGILLGNAPSAPTTDPSGTIAPVSTTFNLPASPLIPPVTVVATPISYSSSEPSDPAASGGAGSDDPFAGTGMEDPTAIQPVVPGNPDPTSALMSFLDPLVVNPSGAVTLTTAGDNGITFDLDNSGVPQEVGWITPGEGFLVSDPDATPIVSGSQMIGTTADLSAFDSNADGTITPADAGYGNLAVWMPGSNGVGGTIIPLAKLGITEIDLTLSPQDVVDHGNIVIGSFSFVAGGTSHSGAQVDLAAVVQGLVPASAAPAYVPVTATMTPTQALQLASQESMVPRL